MRRVRIFDLKAIASADAARGMATVTEAVYEYVMHPVLVGQCKNAILSKAGSLLSGKRR